MHKKNNNKIYSLIKTSLCFCVAISFSITILYAQGLYLANAFKKDNVGFTENKGYQSGSIIRFNSSPIHNTHLETFLVLNETENTEEDELNEDSESKYSSFSSRLYFESSKNANYEKRLAHQLFLFVQNRTAVAFFILYHSWKASCFILFNR